MYNFLFLIWWPLFRKEVGMSLSRYIQSEKIREAKKLLVLTDNSLSDELPYINKLRY